ncbi:isoprenyl transferase [Euzebya tangerina]|uniref:isoprenyl transferase n=1 Tax=Euzebya tangerina TaxID=591198 RepID=UPI000E311668|nr:isoprenyl transferase [Euzebya tangerina]
MPRSANAAPATAPRVGGLLYRLYGKQLERVVRRDDLPQHIGVILDGNRRFARERGLSTAADGHRKGAEKIPELLDWCDELGISYVTLWLLSTDNLGRDEAELSELVGIISDSVAGLVQQRERWPGLKVSGIGALDALPDELRTALKEAAEATADGAGMHVQIAVGYGGRQEITDALRTHLRERSELGESIDDIITNLDPDHISANLYAAGTPDPDLIIRTSGEIRLSGFLLWQSAHSEFYFCDPYWPDFRRIDFLRALREFQSRSRRFGR